MTVQVHWHEGLFLQPHHLQAMQRQMLERLGSARRLAWAYPYGVVEAKISTDELENMRVRFDRLRVVLPSGLELHVPDNAELPTLDIEDAFNATTSAFSVRLGVPLWYVRRANAMEIGAEADWRVKRLYHVVETEHEDENSGENAQTMLMRKINARLLLPEDDDTDLETIPVLRIAHGAGDEGGVPRQDPTFIPPAMVVGGSAVLRELLRDLANQVEAVRKETVVQLTRSGFAVETMRGVQFQQMLRLRTLNNFSGRLGALVHAEAGVSPFEMYLELRALLGELAALQPDLDAFDAPAYDHDNPAVPFIETLDRIRSLLRAEGTATWIKRPFRLEDGVLVAALEDQHITGPNEYFLGIKTDRDPRELARLVEDPDEFKLIATTMARTRVRGVRLEEERHPPMQLPSQVGLHYYRLLRARSERMWDKICSERSVAINFTGVDSSGFDEVALFMTVPD